MMYADHDGHRLSIVPFVEIQARLSWRRNTPL
jgi:hypothetical protein